MARPIRSIEIYLPLDYNDGRPIAPTKHIALQEELLARFGGVTSVQRQSHCKESGNRIGMYIMIALSFSR